MLSHGAKTPIYPTWRKDLKETSAVNKGASGWTTRKAVLLVPLVFASTLAFGTLITMAEPTVPFWIGYLTISVGGALLGYILMRQTWSLGWQKRSTIFLIFLLTVASATAGIALSPVLASYLTPQTGAVLSAQMIFGAVTGIVIGSAITVYLLGYSRQRTYKLMFIGALGGVAGALAGNINTGVFGTLLGFWLHQRREHSLAVS
jgi:hypothetical protein